MEEKLYKVTNRSGGRVVYTVAEMNDLCRDFGPGESKMITEKELNLVNNMPGGRVLLYHFLMVEDPEAIDKLDLNPQPEYFMSDSDITHLLLEGSLDEFLDALDFAPEGVKDVIKDQAVKLPLNDVAKRNALLEKTGFDVSKAIENSKADTAESQEVPHRRVQPAQSGRRAEAPKFNIGTPGASK